MGKTILVFDNDILNSFKSIPEPKIAQRLNDSWLRWDMMYWMKILDCTRKEKKFIRYMFNRNRRIQKKWDKKYNDRYKEINKTPFITWLSV